MNTLQCDYTYITIFSYIYIYVYVPENIRSRIINTRASNVKYM